MKKVFKIGFYALETEYQYTESRNEFPYILKLKAKYSLRYMYKQYIKLIYEIFKKL